jgi:hypothetical protein
LRVSACRVLALSSDLARLSRTDSAVVK